MEWLSMMFGGAGRGWTEAALLIGLFWAALGHPERIRNLTEFRLATVLLGLSLVVPVMVQLFLMNSPLNMLRQPAMGGPGQDAGIAMYSMAVAPALTMMSLILGVDSVTPRSRPRGQPPEGVV